MQTLQRQIEETQKQIDKLKIIQKPIEEIKRLENYIASLEKYRNSRCGIKII